MCPGLNHSKYNLNSAVNSMASRRHHHHDCLRHQNHHHDCLRHQNHHHNSIPLVATSSLCCTYGDSIPCCTKSNHSSPPPDNLLHLVASYLQNQQQETKCSCESPYQSCNVIRRQHQKKNIPQSREYDHVVLSCLLRKIDDLESSLEKFSANYDQRRDRHSTLRDSAARVIQTHFRSYLVRRSISFRYLKELASIKSSFLSLKSSISGKSMFPFKAVFRRASDLLLQLDSIQGSIDPMIRNSKRSLSRDLVRFLQYVDDCAMKRCEFVAKSTIDVSFKGSRNKLNGKKPQDFSVVEDRTIEKSRNRMGKIVVSCSEDEDSNAELEDMTTDDSDEVQMNSIDMRKNSSSKSKIGGLVKGNLVKHPVKRCVVIDKNRNVHHENGNTDDLSSSAEEDSVDVGEETLVMSRVNGVRHGLKTRKGDLVKGSGGKTTRVVKKVSYDKNGNLYMVYVDKNDQTSSAEDDSGDGDDEILVTCRDDESRQGSETRKRVLVKGSGGKASQVVKTVRFDEKGNIYKVYGDTPESSINEGDDSTNGSNNGNGEETKNTSEIDEMIYAPKQNENFEEGEEEEETHSENEVFSSEGSERYTIDTRNINQLGNSKDKEVQHPKGRLMYTPPLPLRMEP